MDSTTPPVAGPSTERAVPLSFLVTLGNTHPSSLSGTQDLLTTFELQPTYATYVKPYLDPSLFPALPPPVQSAASPAGAAPSPAKSGLGTGGITFTLGGTAFGGPKEGAQGGGGKKLPKPDKQYSSLVQDIPGRNTIKKDRHLQTLVMNPDFHPPPPGLIGRLFSGPDGEGDQLLREAFTLQVGEIPGFDSGIWEAGQEGGKKKKKKRKAGADDAAANGGAGGSGINGEEEHRKKKKRREGNTTAQSP